MWKVTIWRIGSGGGQVAFGKTLAKAYASAREKAGKGYLTGLCVNGDRYGPDISAELDKHFAGAVKLIKGRKSCTRASSEKGYACVEIERPRS